MFAHDHFDSSCSLLSVIEWDDGDVVVENVGLNDAVEQGTTDEAEVTINSRCSARSKSPCLRSVMGDRRVCMLQIRNSNCIAKVS